MKHCLTGVVAALLSWHTAAQAQPGPAWLTKKEVALRSAPADSAKTAAVLMANTPVTQPKERNGAWVKVEAPGPHSGWIHMFDLKSERAAPTGGTLPTALRTLGHADRSSRTSTVATATAGVRGLDANDLANAKPDTQAVARAEKWQTSEAAARQFASRNKLRAQSVEDLPTPEVPQSTESASGGRS